MTESLQKIRVMTYNIHKCLGRDKQHRPDRIVAVIKEYQPDICVLQEVDVGYKIPGGIHQPEYLDRELSMTSHFQPAIVDGDTLYGNMVFSRFDFKLVGHQTLPDTPVHKRIKLYERILSSTYEPRGAIWLEADVNGQTVHIFATHLGLSRAERMAQLKTIMSTDWMGAERVINAPTLFLGDLNDTPGSLLHRKLSERLFDSQMLCDGHRRRKTFMSWWPLRCLDHIFVSRHWHVHAVDVPRTGLTRQASDHLPVIADLILKTDSTKL